MTAKSVQTKLQELEALRAKLAEAEAEIKGARESVIASVRDLFDDGTLATLRAMEVARITVDLSDDGVQVTLREAGTSNGGNGGAKAAEYWAKFQAGQTISQIAKEYGVRASTVSSAIKPFRAAASE